MIGMALGGGGAMVAQYVGGTAGSLWFIAGLFTAGLILELSR